MAKPLKDEGDMIVCLKMSANKKADVIVDHRWHWQEIRDWDYLYTMHYLFKEGMREC